MKRVIYLFLCLAVGISFLFFDKIVFYCTPWCFKTESMVYRQIKDIRHPEPKDYALIQKYLLKGSRSKLGYLKDTEPGARKFKMVDKAPGKILQYGKICVNCPEDHKENCILIYASFNKNYPKALERLSDFIAKSDFKGHVLYRLGGWPNVEGGDLELAHVPYSFKIAFFREALRLGYKRALWLDTSIVPLISLNEIFSHIESQGYLAVANSLNIGPYFNEKAAKALGVTLEESAEIPSCSAGIFGLDFMQPHSLNALTHWYNAAKDADAFYSARSDQNALSVILYKLGLRNWISHEKIAEKRTAIRPDCVFLIDRDFSYGKK